MRRSGELVAAVLTGAWRPSPPPFHLSAAELREVAPLLLATGGGALAWWRIDHADLPELRGSEAASDLHQAFRLHVLQAAIHEKQIESAVTLLRRFGIEPLLAKGWAAARLYPEPGLRPYGDIDLYVRPEQYRAALHAVSLPDVRSGPVDLHAGLADLADRTPDEITARSLQVRLGGLHVRILCPADHLRLLCLHLLRHGVERPSWLCDVSAAVESLPRGFDWERCLGGEPRRSRWVACALGLAGELLGARLEGTPVAEMANLLPSWLAPNVLRQWGAGFRPRQPLGSFFRHPAGVMGEIRRHWPNPIEGTVGVGGPFNELPRLPFQLAHGLIRSARFASRLPRLMREYR